MKLFFVGLTLFSGLAQANLEHISGQGLAPSSEKISRARGCFLEMENLGCGHPRDDQAFFITCLEDKSDKLSSDCLSFFNRLYGKRK